MKKVFFSLIILVVSIMLAPFSYKSVNAEETIQIETIYPEDILDYTNLTNISTFSINDNFIAYTLDKSTLTLLKKSTREYFKIEGFNNISKIKFAKDKIIVADSSKIRIVDTNNLNVSYEQLASLSDISLDTVQALDIHITDNQVLIGIIINNTFKLYEYSIDLETTKTNPIKTVQSSYYSDAFMLAINNHNAYIVYNTSENGTTTGLCIQNFITNAPVVQDKFKPYARVIDTFYYNETEYIITFTNEILYLLSSDGSSVCSVNIETQENLDDYHFPILKVTDIDFYNNQIYVCDSTYKTIQTFDIIESNDTINLKSQEILLCSSSFDKGRFNNVSDIYLQGSNIFTADTKNNRIHYIKDNKSYFIDDLETDSKPSNVVVDNENKLYLIKNDSYKSTICRYIFENNQYKKHSEYNTIGNINIGFISDTCVTNANTVYLLDYTNEKILSLSNNGLETIRKFDNINENSKIEYLKGLDKLALLNDSNLYLLNLNGNISAQIQLTNCIDITVDFDKIYTHSSNNQIGLVLLKNNELTQDTKTITIPNNITNLNFDIVKRKMIGFESNRSCLVSFDCNLTPSPFTIPEIVKQEPLKDSDILLPINLIQTCLIYEYPYEIGDFYNIDGSITQCIGIGEFDNYYQVLFNHSDEVKIGYLLKSNSNVVEYNYNPINVITTYKNVAIYRYPTILKYNNQRLITSTLDINTPLTLSCDFPISIDGKTFYVYKKQNTIGFIFSVDVVLNQNTNIKNLNTENATVKLMGEEKITLLDEDKQTKILDIQDNSRIYVENYDKHSDYTYIIYKDSDLNTYEGYIETKNIQMDELDNSQLILILIIVISVILLALIIVAYFVIKKKNK